MKYKKKRKKFWNESHTTVLKLNKAYMPIDICTWEDAISDWYTGRAEIISYYDDVVLHSGRKDETSDNVAMNCPCIIRMTDSAVTQHDTVKTLPLNRKTLLERDGGECCYCGIGLDDSTMTVEHVYPESKGGLSDWSNLRACCYACNHHKANRLLSDIGWTLRKRVGVPTLTKDAPKSIINKIAGRIPHESWRPYIYWQVNTETKLRHK